MSVGRPDHSVRAVTSGPDSYALLTGPLWPLLKERSDDAGRVVVSGASKPGTSRATWREEWDREWARDALNGAAPEGAERHLMGDLRVIPSSGPQWSRSRRSGATPRQFQRAVPCQHRLNGAAPGGAERRGRGLRRRLKDIKPQWSRSRRSGATPPPTCPTSNRPSPQWSRSRRSGATVPRVAWRPGRDSPQWSRSRRSGATFWWAGLLRRDHRLPQWSRSRRSGATRENRGQGDLRIVVASMEPLPEERSDVAGLQKFQFLYMPQWSRSRRSGATTTMRTGLRGRTVCLNGAAPGGAERRPRGGTPHIDTAARSPQWSRSRRSGATAKAFLS